MKLLQASTLNALMLGNFDRTISVRDFLKEADTGIGTYTGLDGEAIFMNGIAYNGTADGDVRIMKEEDGVAFGTVCRFDENVPIQRFGKANLETLKKQITPANRNVFTMLKSEPLRFSKMHIRSCYPSEKPYPTLSEVACQQKEFHLENIEGTVIALYCPDYVEGINLPGWHLHFLSSDKTRGGHILGLECEEFDYKVNTLNEFDLILPENPEFAKLNLTEDLSAKTAAVGG